MCCTADNTGHRQLVQAADLQSAEVKEARSWARRADTCSARPCPPGVAVFGFLPPPPYLGIPPVSLTLSLAAFISCDWCSSRGRSLALSASQSSLSFSAFRILLRALAALVSALACLSAAAARRALLCVSSGAQAAALGLHVHVHGRLTSAHVHAEVVWCCPPDVLSPCIFSGLVLSRLGGGPCSLSGLFAPPGPRSQDSAPRNAGLLPQLVPLAPDSEAGLAGLCCLQRRLAVSCRSCAYRPMSGFCC